MAVSRVVLFLCVILAALMALASSQSIAPAPAPTSDGASVDQAVAKIVARTDNLTQVSQSRLGKMGRDSPRPFSCERSLRRPAQFLSERASRSAKGARLSETLQPERGAGRGNAIVWLFLESEMVYACLDWIIVLNA
ncbi:hypothetical protein DEO72_LG7g1427 [Vigna unguiculata]|uniref:Uncharacterized protein n=1 Tax=Vigna unguiculata TaxID=3917 RepID=A0A4D6MHE5_VIGUN|nr:hypothetical protein DEO72_LG7g1427 [Vigna unguiculata]